MLDVAVDKLEDIQAKVKYISFEPLLKRLTLSLNYTMYYSGVSWVIIGSQTKPYKPPQIEWAHEIVEAADKAGIPVFLKNNLIPLFANINDKVPNIYKSWFGECNCFGVSLRQEIPE